MVGKNSKFVTSRYLVCNYQKVKKMFWRQETERETEKERWLKWKERMGKRERESIVEKWKEMRGGRIQDVVRWWTEDGMYGDGVNEERGRRRIREVGENEWGKKLSREGRLTKWERKEREEERCGLRIFTLSFSLRSLTRAPLHIQPLPPSTAVIVRWSSRGENVIMETSMCACGSRDQRSRLLFLFI